MPNGRCRMHGGKSRSGAASGTYRHGLYSKALPEHLAQRFAEAAEDRRLLELREEIALMDVRTKELLGRLEAGDTGEIWSRLQALVEEMELLQDSGRDAEAVRVLAELLQLVRQGAGEQEYERVTWNQIDRQLERRRRLVESERRRLLQMKQMVSVEEVMTLVGALVATVKEHIPNRRVQTAIGQDIARLLHTERLRK
jgi:galactokinase